jgi:predicted site-specific integrase-resolvase
MSYGVTPQLRAPLQKRGRDAYSALGGDPYSFGSKARRLGATSANNLNCGRGFGRLARMIESTVVADKGKRVEVVGYMRTSSATNVGDGKDSEARQRKAIEGYAQASGAVIVDWFYDAAVSGADPIEVRPGFAELLARIADNGVRTIIVETANRFARDLMVQEVGYAMLRSLGVTLVAADSPSSFLNDGPTSNLIRQLLGAVSEFDKAMTVAKLMGARDRVRRA